MSRSFTAPQALLLVQDISGDCSDGNHSNSEIDDALDKDLEKVELNSSRKESGVISSGKRTTTIHRIRTGKSELD